MAVSYEEFTLAAYYADDMVLISSLQIKLQALLEICYDFEYKNDLLFNTKQSTYFVL